MKFWKRSTQRRRARRGNAEKPLDEECIAAVVDVVYSLGMNSHEDKVWFDRDRKLEGICRDVTDAKANGSNGLILAHFKSTLAEIEESLRTRSIEYKSYLPLDFSSLCGQSDAAGDRDVWVGLASYFQSKAFSAAKTSKSSLHILIAEHHPMASRDQALLDAARSLPCATQVIFHSSLTDPVLQHFGTDKIGGLMKQLGMQEQDFISHRLISSAITTAQEKIERKIQLEMQTQSPEDWFKYNKL
jgi:hypothetical protein